ncbi:MAG: YveK family protein [Anaerolineae bacterium]
MQLRDYFRLLTKRGWLIILIMVLAAASALVFSRLQQPVYRSTVYLNVYPARLDWGLQQSIQNLMRNYAGVIASRDLATEVNDRLQLDITPDQLRAKLTVSPIESDFLLKIDANDYDPVMARDIAQTTAEVFVERIKVTMLDQDKADRVDVSIRDYALPGILYKPKWKINTLAGALFGLIAGVIVVYILEWLETDVIRSAQDAERQTHLSVLGIIPALAPPSRRNALHAKLHQQ